MAASHAPPKPPVRPRAPWARLRLAAAGLTAAAAVVGVAACSTTRAQFYLPPEEEEPPPPAPPDEGTLRFDEEEPLQLGPGSSGELHVTVDPPRQTTVRFALLDEVGTASLASSFANTGVDGKATMRLTAANQAATFRVRATVGAYAAYRSVSVVGVGLASVQVESKYTGQRADKIKTWTLSARSNKSCADLGAAPTDGPLSVTVPNGGVPLLSNVPVGPPLAVLLRGEGLVSGCADVTGLFVGERRDVTLVVVNVPLSLTKSRLALSLSVEPAQTSWGPLTASWEARFRGAFLGGRTKASQALLDAMSLRVVGTAGIDFQKRRVARDWDTAVEATYANGGPDVLVSSWLPAATGSVREAPGPIRGGLRAGNQANAPPTFVPAEIFRLRPDLGDKIGLFDFTWKVDASDRLSLGGAMTFAPTRLLARALGDVILEAEPAAASPQAGLVAVGRCDEVADILMLSGSVVDGCDVACVAKLCSSALEDMWDRSVRTDEIAGTSAKITFGGAGDARFDAEAGVTGFDGEWSGKITDSAAKDDELSATAKGVAEGVEDPSAP